MISLYDYLGYKAGSELGKQVFKYSKITGASVGAKTVDHSPYKNGEIMTYERKTLDQFFKVKDIFIINNVRKEENLLDINSQLAEETELKTKIELENYIDSLPY